MESKFGIFVVLATLARSCFAVESSAYELPLDQLDIFQQITRNEEECLEHKYEAFDPVFDILDSLSAVLIFDLKNENDTTAAIIEEALGKAYNSIDNSLNAIALGSTISCSASVETARSETYASISNVFKLASEAIELAATGNYGKNHVEIDELRSAATNELVALGTSVYNLFPTCGNITDADVLSTIAASKNSVDEDFAHIVNSVFNGIKLYADAVATGYARVDLIGSIENARTDTRNGLKSLVQHEYSMYKSVVLYSNFDVRHLSTLHLIQYSWIASAYSYKEAIDNIFDTVTDQLKSLAIGLSEADPSVFSSIDAAKAKTFADFEAGLRVLIDTVLKLNPEASTTAAHTWEWIVTFYNDVGETFYSAILSTQADTTLSHVLDKLDKSQAELLAKIPDFVARIDKLIVRNGTGVSYLQEEQITAATNLVSAIGDVIRVLANASFAVERVNGESVFAATETLRDAAYTAIDTLTQRTAELLIAEALAEKQ